MWNVVNNLLRKCNNRASIVELLCNDRKTSNCEEMCAMFNDYFASAGVNVQKNIRPKNNKDPDAIEYVDKCNKKLTFGRISEEQITKIVKDMEAKRSCGFDNISNYLLKSIVSVIKMPLCIIFNKSLQNGVFPDLLKLAKVIPLHKGGEHNVTDNYCPISLLPVISKILEKFVYQKTMEHLEKMGYCIPGNLVFVNITQLMML